MNSSRWERFGRFLPRHLLRIFICVMAPIVVGGKFLSNGLVSIEALAQARPQGEVGAPKVSKPALESVPNAAPIPSGSGDGGNPSIHRTVIHTEAYKKRVDIGPHINFKITPPEKRGRKGRVLVEVYNYSKVNLSVVDFWLILSNAWGDKIEVQITCDDIKGGWSALKWVKIPGEKPIPEITTVQIRNMKIFNDQGRETKLKYFTDLIKQ